MRVGISLGMKRIDPPRRGRLTDAEGTTGFDETAVLLEYAVGSLAFEGRSSRPTTDPPACVAARQTVPGSHAPEINLTRATRHVVGA